MHDRVTIKSETERMRREFGRRLTLVRFALGFCTNRDFATALDLKENTTGVWQSGARFPSPPELVRLKQATGYTIDYLYAGDTAGLLPHQVKALADAKKKLADDKEAKTQRREEGKQRTTV